MSEDQELRAALVATGFVVSIGAFVLMLMAASDQRCGYAALFGLYWLVAAALTGDALRDLQDHNKGGPS